LRVAALVPIDRRNIYREGTTMVAGVEDAQAEAARLWDRARRAGVPIFHIQHDAGPGFCQS
jgi:hypothetical protein